MYLLLGDAGDACCLGVKRALSARGFDSRVLANPMSEPVTLSWRLDTWSSDSRLILEDGTRLTSDDLDGVLVRGSNWLATDGWRPTDVDYVAAEVWAALLGWLWSLPCPVVNRYPPWVWFRPSAPVLAWHAAILRGGLIPLETLVTNDPLPAAGFGAWPQEALLYAPLSVEARFVVTERDTQKLLALQRHVPLALTEVPEVSHVACVVAIESSGTDRPPSNTGDSNRVWGVWGVMPGCHLLRSASPARVPACAWPGSTATLASPRSVPARCSRSLTG